MRSFTVLLAAFGATAAMAQSTQNYTSSLEMTLDPNTVEDGERSSWCTAQGNTCHQLCNDEDETNDCDYSTLKYSCKCSNGTAPGLQYYTQTMPTFICQTLLNDCIERTAGSQDDQEACKEDIGSHCATQNPPKQNSSDDDDDATSTDSTATATESASKTNEETAAASTTDADGLAAPASIPQRLGAVFAAGALIALI